MFILQTINLMTSTATLPDATGHGLDLNRILGRQSKSIFFAYARSYSMAGPFIPPGALLVINRSLTPQNGDIVIAEIDGVSMVRFLKKNQYTCWLNAVGKNYHELKVTAGMNMTIHGVVTHILSTPNIIRQI